MKMSKRLISLLLVISMTVSMFFVFSINASAEVTYLDNDTAYEQFWGNYTEILEKAGKITEKMVDYIDNSAVLKKPMIRSSFFLRVGATVRISMIIMN